MVSNIKIIKNTHGIDKVLIKSNSIDVERNVIVQVGKEMVVKPLNKQKLKHRDRRVIINKITDEGFKGVKASVKFLDNNRSGKIDVVDLDDII